MTKNTPTKTLANFDPFSAEVTENPFPFFAALRTEAPVYELPNKAYYLVSRYEDVMQAVMDAETFSSNLVAVLMSSAKEQTPQMLDLHQGDNADDDSVKAVDVLAIADPPKHTRQRRVSNRAFSLRRVQAMAPAIQALAERLVSAALEKQQQGDGFDWVADIAVPLPMQIIIDLLGFPAGDMMLLKRYSDASVQLLSGINTEAQMLEAALTVNEMILYLDKQYQQAKQQPGDNVLGDLLRAAEDDEDHFSRNEIVSMLVQLLTAGNETTRSLIASAMMRLLQEPSLQQRVRADDKALDAFIEEMLRLESPFYGHFRVTTKDTELGGTFLPAGSRLMLLWASANRDEQQYANAETIDLNRSKPKQHLAFGYGIHHCIGAELARMETKIILQSILQHTQNLALLEGNDFRHTPSLFVRSLERLLVKAD